MNGTAINPDIPLAVIFPLPFQILALVGLAILGWATNLHGLDVAGIDVISSMDLRTDVSSPLPAHYPAPRQSSGLVALYRSVYRIFIAYASLCFASWIVYRYTTHGDARLVDVFGYIPGMVALSLVCILLCPYNILHKTERRKFLQAIRRCLLSSSDSPVYFSDVVLADIFTSFAQVIGDVWLSLCMLLPGHSILNPTAGVGLSRWILPTVMSFPSLVRLRQCVIEYSHQSNTSRRPLYNALKYATAFPVIYLSAAQRITIADAAVAEAADKAWYGEQALFRLWLLAAMVNSLYSFWWDVTNDWGFELLTPRSEEQTREPRSPPKRLVLPDLHSAAPLNPGSNSYDTPISPGETTRLSPGRFSYSKYYQPQGLRATLHFPVLLYHFLIIFDLVLRLTWSMKLFSVLNVNSAASIGNFCLKAAELFRRWMWVFIRVEWEMIKKGRDGKRIDDDVAEYELIPSATIERT
ncbi:Protein ERD1 1 [Hypsizygus marmoreus]|uniref:Protein ERD1 1 n=1 Tax=Hypsizygus marmoreus TaxID=39966 RepID=A0A369JRI7_HYPMA|nr:Protein ERD1 1 [Hypsizygus marmoreus]